MSELFAFNVSNQTTHLRAEGHYDTQHQLWVGDDVGVAETLCLCWAPQRHYLDTYDACYQRAIRIDGDPRTCLCEGCTYDSRDRRWYYTYEFPREV